MKKNDTFFNPADTIENLLSDAYGSQIHELSHELISLDDAAADIMWNQSKPLLNSVVEFRELMMMYGCAIKEIKTKFEILNTEFKIRYHRNPINSISTRLKSTASIIDKLEKKNLPFSAESIEENINDIAGVRVICSYVDDIFEIAKAFTQQDDIELIKQKDYIGNPKSNGYRSLHLIVSVPVYFAEYKKQLKVEVQIRTISMEYWASLEHQLHYKKQIKDEEEIAEQLRECAELIASIDSKMLYVRTKIEESGSDLTEDEILLEKLSKIDLSME